MIHAAIDPLGQRARAASGTRYDPGTILGGDAVEFYAEITSWRASTSWGNVSWSTELHPYPSARYTNEVRGDLTLYGSW